MIVMVQRRTMWLHRHCHHLPLPVIPGCGGNVDIGCLQGLRSNVCVPLFRMAIRRGSSSGYSRRRTHGRNVDHVCGYRLTIFLMGFSVVALVATVRDDGPGEELQERGVSWMYLFTASLPHRPINCTASTG